MGRAMEELWEALESGMGEEVSPQSRPKRREGRRGERGIIEPIAETTTTHGLKVQNWLIIDKDEPWVNIVLRVATANAR